MTANFRRTRDKPSAARLPAVAAEIVWLAELRRRSPDDAWSGPNRTPFSNHYF